MPVTFYYNKPELQRFGEVWQSNALSGADRTFARALWQNGFRTWESAPLATGNKQDGTADNLTYAVTVTGVTKQQVIDFIQKFAGQFEWLQQVISDFEVTAVET
jgi:hypothetical protein